MPPAPEGTTACGECFALVLTERLRDHMDWHRYAAPVRRAGPVLDEKKRRGEV